MRKTLQNLLYGTALLLGLSACDCDGTTVRKLPSHPGQESSINYCDSGSDDSQPPQVTLTNPEDGTLFENQNVINLEYTTNDNRNSDLECTLYTNILGELNVTAQQTVHVNSLCEPVNGNFTLFNVPNGTYEWNVSCIDALNNTGQAENNLGFVVNNGCGFPNTTPTLNITAVPTTVLPNSDVLVAVEITDGNTPYSCNLDFGDGNQIAFTASTANTHTYSAIGTYQTTASCSDCNGDIANKNITVKVVECLDDIIEHCGVSGIRFRECVDGTLSDWSNCTDCETTRTLSCGINDRGVQEQDCVNGQYEEGECLDPDSCQDGMADIETSCNINGRGDRYRLCSNGQFTDWSECTPIDECLDYAVESLCCGYDGEGTKSRTCVTGSWSNFSECSIPNFINASNNAGRVAVQGYSYLIGFDDYAPSLDSNQLTFSSDRNGCDQPRSVEIGRTGCSQVYYLNLEDLTIESECLSCSENISEPNVSLDPFSQGDLYHYCNRSSVSSDHVGFECTWIDDDSGLTFEDDIVYGIFYLNNLSNGTPVNLWNDRRIRGFGASVDNTFFALKVLGNNQGYDISDAGAFGRNAETVTGTIQVFDDSGTLVHNFGSGTGFPKISGDYVVFESMGQSNISGIYLGNMNTGVLRRISGRGLHDTGYQPSIDGSDVVFVSDRDGSKQLYHFNITNSNLSPPITSCGNNSEPSVSQGKVAFTSNRNGNDEIYVCDLAQTSDCCTGARNISNSFSSDRSPSLSGCKVAYVTEVTGDQEVFVYDLCEGNCR